MPPPEHRANDTPRSYAALVSLAAMGPGRSLEKYRLTTGKSPAYLRQLERWSSDHDWQNRIIEYDRAIAAAEEAQRAQIRAKRRIDLENADWETGKAIRDLAQSILLELPKFKRDSVQRIERTDPLTKQITITEVITLALKAGPGELAKALELASKLQRLSVGEATDIHKLVESELGAMLDLLQSQLTPEEYARVVAVIAGGASAGG